MHGLVVDESEQAHGELFFRHRERARLEQIVKARFLRELYGGPFTVCPKTPSVHSNHMILR